MTALTAHGTPVGRLLRLMAAAAAGFVLATGGAAAGLAAPQSADADEFAIKAAFVYNFAKFATWPASAFAGPQASLVLCVLGEVPFRMALSSLQGKPVGERTLSVRDATPDSAAACHLLVLGGLPAARIANLAAALKGRPVLTVSDAEGFAGRGGAIGLVIEDSRVRFEVNPHALDGSGVTLSSQMLRLARIVEGAR